MFHICKNLLGADDFTLSYLYRDIANFGTTTVYIQGGPKK